MHTLKIKRSDFQAGCGVKREGEDGVDGVDGVDLTLRAEISRASLRLGHWPFKALSLLTPC